MTATVSYLLSLLATLSEIPRQSWAPLVGTLVSWGATQRMKSWLPSRWSPKARELSTETIAFAVGWLATGLIWGGAHGWVVGFVVGLWSPALWKIAMFVIGLKWPTLVDKLKAKP